MSARYMRKCVRKRRHETRESAQQHRASLVAAGARKGSYDVYRCDQCGYYHVGRPGRARHRSRKERNRG